MIDPEWLEIALGHCGAALCTCLRCDCAHAGLPGPARLEPPAGGSSYILLDSSAGRLHGCNRPLYGMA